MVCVRLESEWVDQVGARHSAGELVDVDAGTLADLEARGIVNPPAETQKSAPRRWAGPGSPDRD